MNTDVVIYIGLDDIEKLFGSCRPLDVEKYISYIKRINPTVKLDDCLFLPANNTELLVIPFRGTL